LKILKKIIEKEYAYVDKTLLIKEFWKGGADVILAPRPRRFGKTLNLSMLKYFFEKTNQNNAKIFENTNVWNDPELRAVQGQYPVIFLTFKDIRANSWESAQAGFADIISEEYKRLLHCIKVEKIGVYDIDIFNRIATNQASEQELIKSLQFLSRILYEQTGKKAIILIDEYDAPIINAYLRGYYQQMIDFVRNLLSKALKSNFLLEKAFLTGITRIAKEDIFSGLNHFSVHTVLDTKYSDKFGFTQEEVDQLLTNYDLMDKKDEIKSWYDGYVFGNTNIYNPWSLLQCIESDGICKTYWANTSGNELVKNIITNNSNEVIKKELELLLQNNILENKKIDINITLPDLANKDQEPWSFLLFTGYLAATSHIVIDEDYYYTLAIPNTEIIKLYRELVLQALNAIISFEKLRKLMEAFIAGDRKAVEQCLQGFITDTCSSHDVAKNDLERNVHMFVLGLLAGLSNRYLVQSNRESGDGQYDIMLKPKKPQDPGILIEFKRATKDDSEALAVLSQEALKQIKDFDYAAQMRIEGYHGSILCYGIAVCGKHLVVAMETI